MMFHPTNYARLLNDNTRQWLFRRNDLTQYMNQIKTNEPQKADVALQMMRAYLCKDYQALLARTGGVAPQGGYKDAHAYLIKVETDQQYIGGTLNQCFIANLPNNLLQANPFNSQRFPIASCDIGNTMSGNNFPCRLGNDKKISFVAEARVGGVAGQVSMMVYPDLNPTNAEIDTRIMEEYVYLWDSYSN